jgi:hypothetical protein
LNGKISNYSCSSLIRFKMTFATSRLFVEAYTDAVRNKITEKMTEMIDNIVLGFQVRTELCYRCNSSCSSTEMTAESTPKASLILLAEFF